MVTASPDSTAPLPLTTIFSFLFFGTNFLFYFLFLIHDKLSSRSLTATSPSETPHKKKLSLAFDGTLTCYTNLTTELFITGCIIIATYIFENHWIFEHSQKEYSRDLFVFVCLIFFIYALYTIKPITDLSLLGRDQTEEWKGWMQFIFLLYHYFHAEEVYNSVRVMITCYVWMTGFGNFSFFYMKQDFGWLRVMQMLWRLNFAVLLLMMIHNNTYILYYICPLHTFYFLMVYSTMFIMQSVNHSMWGIRIKLIVLGIVIYLLWDYSSQLFDLVFFFLGTDSVVGAKQGTLWEWYFRSGLDHWSTFYGMIFALNFPLAEQYFKSANKWALGIAGSILFALSVWWYLEIYSLDKLAYNLHHSYFAFIPLTAYIFFRNLTPSIRSGVSMSLHVLGKTTLETYLLQHHVWLTSNAKTLLTLVPDMPWVNFALASILFYYLSHELYRITMSLRGMILPENKEIAFRNMIGTALLMAFFTIVASVLHFLEVSWLGIGLGSLALFILLSVPMKRLGKGFQDNDLFQTVWKKMIFLCVLLFFVGLGYQLSLSDSSSGSSLSSSTSSGSSSSSAKVPALYGNPSLLNQCHQSVTSGHWDINTLCPPESAAAPSSHGKETPAHCLSSEWNWNPKTSTLCQFHQVSPKDAMAIFKNRHVYFLGDSTIRLLYHRFNHLLDPSYTPPVTDKKHENFLQRHSSPALNATVEFRWTPFLRNISTELSSTFEFSKGEGVWILGATLWDVLHDHSLNEYQEQLSILQRVLQTHSNPSQVYWISPLHVVNHKLNTEDKRSYMTEEAVEMYRGAVKKSGLQNVLRSIDSSNVTAGREEETTDGVHYSPEIYDVLVQLLTNSFLLDHYRDLPSASGSVAKASPAKAYSPKPTGSMSNPTYGLVTFLVAVVMILTWDNFFGLGWLSLKCIGKAYDWNEAYVPLLKKILPHNYRDADEERGRGRGVAEGEDEEEKKPMLLEMSSKP
jgi:N-acetylneuraminate 9-O-acetyltransferase